MTDFEEEGQYQKMRQISISAMGESVNLLSTFKDEDMNYLVKKALEILKELKQNGNK